MSDTFKLPEGFGVLDEEVLLEENKVEEVPKDEELNLKIVDEEQTEEPSGLNALKEKGIISQDNVTGTFTEETARSIIKMIDKVQGKEVEQDVSLIESLVGAGVSSGIKIPKGLVTFATLLADVFRDENIPA